MFRHRIGLTVAAALLLCSAPRCPLSAQESVGTPDVHLLAMMIQDEVEVIRWQMGRPPEMRAPIPVDEVTIRENFGQAMTLWRKVNQLAVELVGGGESPPAVPIPRDGVYGPEQVHVVLTSILARLGEIREGVGVVGASALAGSSSAPVLDRAATPTDVFETIVQANRQVNRMLERQFQPSDVYQQVQQAIFYASEILASAGDDTPFPAVPEYEPGLQPGHVYGRLLVGFDRLEVAFDELDLEMVSWSGEAYVVDESLTPSDVFDVATLLLSELEYLHSLVPGARVPIQAAHPGRRFPSDVYQQAGLLGAQTARLMAQARANPELLRPGRSP